MFIRPTNSANRRGSVAYRVGLCFLAIAVLVWAVSALSPNGGGNDRLPDQRNSLASSAIPWAIVSALVTVGGIVSIYSLSSLACIERQLIRVSESPTSMTNERSREGDDDDCGNMMLTPIIGNDPAVRGFNTLLHATQRADRLAPERAVSQLDDSAITHARAMRALDTVWIITDEWGAIRYHSPKAKGLLNLKEDTNELLFEVLQIDEPGMIERLLGRVRVVRLSVQVDWDDEETHLDVTRSRLRGRDGDCAGMVWLIDDRTAQTQALRSRDEFLMAATHELRTPLTNLRAYAETLAAEEGVDIDDQKKFCNVIVSESVRMGRLVDQLLSMGQIEAGSLVMNRHEVDLHQILGDVRDQVLGQAEEKHQTIQMEIADKLPIVFGDSEHLRSAIINLAGNAVKYTPERGEVTIRCHYPEAKPEDQSSISQPVVCIEIIDTGPGIAEEDQPRVFEKFYRCPDSATNQRGNGLGLSLAQQVARLHGGQIRLESRSGCGSHFTLELPATTMVRSGLGH